MTSPPDLSSLSLGPSSAHHAQRVHDPSDYGAVGSTQGGGAGYFQTAPAMQGPFATMGASPLRNRPPRAGLPSQWIDGPVAHEGRPLSPPNTDLSSLSSGGGSPPPMGLGQQQVPPLINTPQLEDDIIPTAIVIKNIPFNVKREALLDIIASLSIPTPYAFNYHLDQSGQFRGLAFANFRQAADADAVVAALNGFDVQGRKLRVEYKKVLQAGEKERIEREKALRRMRSMQLEKEQQNAISAQTTYDDYGSVITPGGSIPGPVGAGVGGFTTPQRSFSAGASNIPWQTPQTYSPPPMPPMPHLTSYNSVNSLASAGGGSPPGIGRPTTPGSSIKTASTELDLNDPATLEIYSRILLFKDDRMRDELAFSRTLTAKQRRIVHLVAQKLGVYHYSVGEGEERYAVVTRINPESQQQAAPRLARAPSAYHLSATAAAQAVSPSLRMKKSMPDIGALRTQHAPRLNTRMSNSNMREGFATIASPARRSPGALNALFGGFGPGTVPPVPTLPASVAALNGAGGGLVGGGGLTTPGGGLAESPTNTIVRQPRGPGASVGFGRREKAPGTPGEGKPPAGLEARSHEPLEI